MLAVTIAPPPFSYLVFGILLVIFLSSTAVFFALANRMTRGRHGVLIGEWARQNRATLRPLRPEELPPPIAGPSPAIHSTVRCRRGNLLELSIDQRRWHVLVCKTGSEWAPTGLRPSAHEHSIFDPLELPVFPAYSSLERFHLVSSDQLAARKLSRSSTRALIPADVGMLLWEGWMILDFTRRPFDTIEFGRMLALAEQVVRSLP